MSDRVAFVAGAGGVLGRAVAVRLADAGFTVVGVDRLAHADAVPTTALAVTTELFCDWASPPAGPAREFIYWYFDEVPKLTDQVGVAEAEKLAAAAAKEGQ